MGRYVMEKSKLYRTPQRIVDILKENPLNDVQIIDFTQGTGSFLLRAMDIIGNPPFIEVKNGKTK
jgi:hypothetical protein